MTYQAAIFDLFGTLIDSNAETSAGQRCFYAMADALGAEREVFCRHWLDRAMKRRRFINATGYAGHLLEVCVRFEHQPTPEQVEAAWQCRVRFTRACLAPRPGALEMLAALREQGYRVGLISDCSWEVPHLWPDTPFAGLFDTAVFSCDVGAVKPDPSIYLHACRLLGVEPSACLYFGDGNSHELTGAQQVGMTPVMLYMPYERELIMRRPGAAEWRGPVVTRMEDVTALAVGYRAVE